MTTTTTGLSRSKQIRSTVSDRAERLQRRFLDDRSGKRPDRSILGQLAALRSARLDTPGADPAVWDVTLADLPDDLRGRGNSPATREELAIHSALVLFAHLQQGRDQPAHRPNQELGVAVRDLALRRQAAQGGSSLDLAVVKRMHAAALAPTHSQRVRHLFGLIQLMHAERNMSLDFGSLAVDLYQLQFPQRVAGVQLRWGRQLHTRSTTSDQK